MQKRKIRLLPHTIINREVTRKISRLVLDELNDRWHLPLLAEAIAFCARPTAKMRSVPGAMLIMRAFTIGETICLLGIYCGHKYLPQTDMSKAIKRTTQDLNKKITAICAVLNCVRRMKWKHPVVWMFSKHWWFICYVTLTFDCLKQDKCMITLIWFKF